MRVVPAVVSSGDALILARGGESETHRVVELPKLRVQLRGENLAGLNIERISLERNYDETMESQWFDQAQLERYEFNAAAEDAALAGERVFDLPSHFAGAATGGWLVKVTVRDARGRCATAWTCTGGDRPAAENPRLQ
jgi:hypothetical protein